MNLCNTKPSWRQGLAALMLTLSAAACASGGSNSSGSATGVSAFACNNQQFLSDRAAFISGQTSDDQAVDVCGKVSDVRSARQTRSGRHGYFYLIAGGKRIEVVSNLDAMRSAPDSWPWVAPGDYVVVRGRYYFDNPQSQGIDWTEADTGRRWSRPGYVVVCNAAGTACAQYQ